MEKKNDYSDEIRRNKLAWSLFNSPYLKLTSCYDEQSNSKRYYISYNNDLKMGFIRNSATHNDGGSYIPFGEPIIFTNFSDILEMIDKSAKYYKIIITHPDFSNSNIGQHSAHIFSNSRLQIPNKYKNNLVRPEETYDDLSLDAMKQKILVYIIKGHDLDVKISRTPNNELYDKMW